MNMIDHLKIRNGERWTAMKIDPDAGHILNRVATRLCDSDARKHYDAVSAATTVPWFIIAVIHEREASQSWKANLAQGDPWNTVSRHVPRGQGPFKSWEDAAVNALSRTPPFAARWTDWGPGGALTLLEMYNGLGYASGPVDRATGHHYPPQASPYIWASSNQYSRGKYLTDHHFDPDVHDHQLGCAALIASMALIDHSVKFNG